MSLSRKFAKHNAALHGPRRYDPKPMQSRPCVPTPCSLCRVLIVESTGWRWCADCLAAAAERGGTEGWRVLFDEEGARA